MEVIYRKLSEMKKLDGNPRKITQEQLDTLKQSIERNKDYFEARLLILSNRTGELVIIAGNQRYEACKQLGIEECPTVLLEGLTEEREKEIIIRDNVSNGEWDEELLQDWDAEDLADWGVDVSILEDEDEEEEEIKAEKIGRVPFTEVLGEEHNYIVLYFDNSVDWLQAQSLFGIQPVRCLSTRKDGKLLHKGFADKIGIGRVVNGAKALNKILEKNENIG